MLSHSLHDYSPKTRYTTHCNNKNSTSTPSQPTPPPVCVISPHKWSLSTHSVPHGHIFFTPSHTMLNFIIASRLGNAVIAAGYILHHHILLVSTSDCTSNSGSLRLVLLAGGWRERGGVIWCALPPALPPNLQTNSWCYGAPSLYGIPDGPQQVASMVKTQRNIQQQNKKTEFLFFCYSTCNLIWRGGGPPSLLDIM